MRDEVSKWSHTRELGRTVPTLHVNWCVIRKLRHGGRFYSKGRFYSLSSLILSLLHPTVASLDVSTGKLMQIKMFLSSAVERLWFIFLLCRCRTNSQDLLFPTSELAVELKAHRKQVPKLLQNLAFGKLHRFPSQELGEQITTSFTSDQSIATTGLGWMTSRESPEWGFTSFVNEEQWLQNSHLKYSPSFTE